MDTWNTEDKAWMKQRRAQWKTTQQRVNKLYFIHKAWKPAIKHYFLTGEDIGGDFGMETLDVAPLIRLWFDPDSSPENWLSIKNEYVESDENHWRWRLSEMRLREELRATEINTESFFNGLEERLFDLFFHRRLKREHYPDLSEAEFNKEAYSSYQGIAVRIIWALSAPEFNPFNSLSFRMDKWLDSFELGYAPERIELEWAVELIDRARSEKYFDRYTPTQVELANKANAVLENPALREDVRQRITEIRKRPGHPVCTDFDGTYRAIMRLDADDAKSIELILYYIDETTRPGIRDEVTESEIDIHRAMRMARKFTVIDQHEDRLVLLLESIDVTYAGALYTAFAKCPGITGCYVLNLGSGGDEDDEEYAMCLQFNGGREKVLYTIEDDETLDQKFRDWDWDVRALDWIVDHKS